MTTSPSSIFPPALSSKIGLALALIFIPACAQAYIGPGAALGVVGYFFGMTGVVIVAVLMALYYPVKVMLRKYRKPKAVPPETDTAPPAPEA